MIGSRGSACLLPRTVPHPRMFRVTFVSTLTGQLVRGDGVGKPLARAPDGTLVEAVTSDATVDRAREAFGRSAWGEAHSLWTEADRDLALNASDLASWAT